MRVPVEIRVFRRVAGSSVILLSLGLFLSSANQKAFLNEGTFSTQALANRALPFYRTTALSQSATLIQSIKQVKRILALSGPLTWSSDESFPSMAEIERRMAARLSKPREVPLLEAVHQRRIQIHALFGDFVVNPKTKGAWLILGVSGAGKSLLTEALLDANPSWYFGGADYLFRVAYEGETFIGNASTRARPLIIKTLSSERVSRLGLAPKRIGPGIAHVERVVVLRPKGWEPLNPTVKSWFHPGLIEEIFFSERNRLRRFRAFADAA